VVDIEGLWPVRARNPSIKSLAEAGVVRQISEGTHDRQFAAPELFDLVTAYEERIAGRPRGS
jgi:hypothetical protein